MPARENPRNQKDRRKQTTDYMPYVYFVIPCSHGRVQQLPVRTHEVPPRYIGVPTFAVKKECLQFPQRKYLRAPITVNRLDLVFCVGFQADQLHLSGRQISDLW
jgi:hypothetical protein